MTLLEKVELIRKTFRLIFPNRPEPSSETLVKWGTYDIDSVERGLVRAARKIAAGQLAEDRLHIYVTGVARNEMYQKGREEGL